MKSTIVCTFLFFTGDLRSRVINQLSSNATGTAKPRFLVALEVKCNITFLIMYAAYLFAHSTQPVGGVTQDDCLSATSPPRWELSAPHDRSLGSLET